MSPSEIPDAMCVNIPVGCVCPDMNGQVFEFVDNQCRSELTVVQL